MRHPRLPVLVPALLSLVALPLAGPLMAADAPAPATQPAPALSPDQQKFWEGAQAGTGEFARAQVEAEAKYVQARAEFANAHFVEAREAVEAALRLYPSHEAAQALRQDILAVLSRRDNRLQMAATWFHALQDVKTQEIAVRLAALMESADAKSKAGDYAGAELDYDRVDVGLRSFPYQFDWGKLPAEVEDQAPRRARPGAHRRRRPPGAEPRRRAPHRRAAERPPGRGAQEQGRRAAAPRAGLLRPQGLQARRGRRVERVRARPPPRGRALAVPQRAPQRPRPVRRPLPRGAPRAPGARARGDPQGPHPAERAARLPRGLAGPRPAQGAGDRRQPGRAVGRPAQGPPRAARHLRVRRPVVRRRHHLPAPGHRHHHHHRARRGRRRRCGQRHPAREGHALRRRAEVDPRADRPAHGPAEPGHLHLQGADHRRRHAAHVRRHRPGPADRRLPRPRTRLQRGRRRHGRRRWASACSRAA